MNPNQDVYLEPAIEINREVIDPLGVAADEEQVIYNITCPNGGC
jgi:hypothetical protein